MFLSRMKPLPRFLFIAIGVAVIVYGAKFAINAMPAKAPEVKAEPVTVTTVPAESAAQPASATTAPAPVQAEQAPLLQPAPTNDAGLANVLNGKK